MDYAALGLKAGLEIHQQLNTKEKLTEIVHEKFIDQNLQFFDKHDKVK